FYLSVRNPHLRGGSRTANRADRNQKIHRRGRLRQGHQSSARRWTDPRGNRPRYGTSTLRGGDLRREWPASHRQLDEFALPRAATLPRLNLTRTETPTPVNPLGIKGIGEAGTIGSIPAVVNAVVDALAPLGVTHIDMPLTPQKIWLLCQEKNAAASRGRR